MTRALFILALTLFGSACGGGGGGSSTSSTSSGSTSANMEAELTEAAVDLLESSKSQAGSFSSSLGGQVASTTSAGLTSGLTFDSIWDEVPSIADLKGVKLIYSDDGSAHSASCSQSPNKLHPHAQEGRERDQVMPG